MLCSPSSLALVAVMMEDTYCHNGLPYNYVNVHDLEFLELTMRSERSLESLCHVTLCK